MNLYEKKGEIQSKTSLIQRQMNEGMSFEETCELLKLREDEISECKAYMDKHWEFAK